MDLERVTGFSLGGRKICRLCFSIDYIDGFSTGKPIDPPTITIELFFEPSEGEIALYMGNDNSDKDNEACGICCRIAFDMYIYLLFSIDHQHSRCQTNLNQ